jgi:hypothetical protein
MKHPPAARHPALAAHLLIGLALAGPPVAAMTASSASGGRAEASRPELPALDYAFRFASAIAKDPKDRAKAQELAIAEFTAAGALDEAIRRADQVEGWRRGAVYADLATALAMQGRSEEARVLLAKADSVRAGVSGWENPRIAAHAARALAALGEGDRARGLTQELAAADPLQYAGQAAATEAAVVAASGDFDQAMARLGALAGQNELETAWWRTMGYLDLAKRDSIARKDRSSALEAARAAAESLPVSRKVEGLRRVAATYAALGQKRDARRTLSDAAAAVDTLAAGNLERIPLETGLAQTWAEAGDPERARAALGDTERLVDAALEIDRPGLLARIASAYRSIPDEARARRLDDLALEAAERMRLSRPRALAVAAVCREMGRSGAALDTMTRARLDALLAGLGDPW